MKTTVLAGFVLFAAPAVWAQGALSIPSYTPRLETPGIYKPVIPGQPGYSGFDAAQVCGNAGLSTADRASCTLDMNTSATDAQRNQVRQRYDMRLATPTPVPPPVGSQNDPVPKEDRAEEKAE